MQLPDAAKLAPLLTTTEPSGWRPVAGVQVQLMTLDVTVPVAKSDPEAISRLQNNAHGKFLSVSYAGPYKKPEAKKGRAISV